MARRPAGHHGRPGRDRALRDPMEALGFKFKYVYEVRAPLCGADKVQASAGWRAPPSLLRHAKIGMMGYRDM